MILAQEVFPAMSERLVKHANTAGTLAWEQELKNLNGKSIVT
jgi:hypothetical protein